MTPTGSRGVSGQGEGLPAAVIEDLLASPRRRKLLACLTERDEPVPVDDLATVLLDADVPTAESISAADRERARQEIYQDLLPKLTATDVVRFDSMLGTVEFTGPEALSARLSALTNPCSES
jgi:hypothetical protein